MKRNGLKGVAVGLLLVLTACSRGTIDSNLLNEDSNGNNNIYRNYNVDYSEETGKGMAVATFSVGGSWGTTVRLVEPASFKINGETPASNTDVFDGGEVAAFYAGFIYPPAWFYLGASGTTYHKSFTDSASALTFEFIDNTGTQFVETAQIPAVGLSVPSLASPYESFQISVYGADSESRLYVRLKQGTHSKGSSGSGTTVTFSAEDLEGFTSGPVEVSAEVHSSQTIESDSESLGGRIRINYQFSKRTMQLR